VSDPRLYRAGITAVDPSPNLDASSNALPDIRLDLDVEQLIRNPGANTAPRIPPATHGYDCFLAVLARITGGETATLKLWMLVPATDGVDSFWAHVQDIAVAESSQTRLQNLPGGTYRLQVSVLSGGQIDLILMQTV
jgi:hypothetical protein